MENEFFNSVYYDDIREVYEEQIGYYTRSCDDVSIM